MTLWQIGMESMQDAIGQSSSWEDNGFYEWLYWIASN